MKTGSLISIDFGTSNTSIVSVMRDEHGEKIAVLGEEGEFPFASLLAISNENKLFFGNKVRKSRDQLAESCKLVASFKSLLGTEKCISVNGKEISPTQLTSEYFRCLKKVVLKKYNIDIREAAFSFPVDFSPEARLDLIEAAQKADIKVVGLVSESTAAYMAVRDKVKGKSRVMVVDWGGGTLDISILETSGQRIREAAVYGEKIGGDDVDNALAQRVHALISDKLDDKSKVRAFEEMSSAERDKMLSAAERAKIQLSEDGEEYPLTIRDYGDYGTKTVFITNEMFTEMVKPIIRNRVLAAINTAMERAKVTTADIDAVVIAGGSSYLRPYSDAMLNLFGEEKIILPEKPQFISAIGAAAAHFTEGKFKLSDDLGIMLSDGSVLPLLKKDKDGVGSKSERLSFSLVEDSTKAHIIVANGSGRVLERMDVPAKGFLVERFEISAEIGNTQIAEITVHSNAAPEEERDAVCKVNGLSFYYELPKA